MAKVALVSCKDFPTCIRLASMAGLALLTLGITAILAARLAYVYRKCWTRHHVLISIFQLEMLVFFLYYSAFPVIQMKFLAFFLRNVGYSVITFFFLSIACQLFKRERLVKCLLIPCLIGIVLVLLCALGLAMHDTVKDEFDCGDISWLISSSLGFFLNLVFLMVGLVITRKLKKVNISSKFRNQQNMQLWSLIVLNCICTGIVFCIDVGFFFHRKRCDYKKWTGNIWVNTGLGILLRSLSQYVHVWALIIVFFPLSLQRRTRGARRITRRFQDDPASRGRVIHLLHEDEDVDDEDIHPGGFVGGLMAPHHERDGYPQSYVALEQSQDSDVRSGGL